MQQEIRKQVIKNAYLHGGKADASSVVGKLISLNPEIRKDMKNVMKSIQECVNEVNSMTRDQIEEIVNTEYSDILVREKKDEKHRLPDLPNVKGSVVMRMAPSPSGPLHIGHSRMAILNDEYVKRYGGKLILRIEDTNPANIDSDAYKLIPEDLKWLGVNVGETVIQSSRMEFYYSEAKRMISEGYMYAIEENQQEFHDLKLKKVPVRERDADPSYSLEKFDRMISGYYSDGQAALVMKTEIDHPNPSVRDWIAFRINTHEHPRTGSRYVAYPTMNFSVAVDDHYLGLTHVIRGIDHLVNTEKQKYVFKYNNWNIPEYFHYGFITIPDTILKTTIIKEGIKSGKYSGWDDIRLGTLMALKKRGYNPETFRNYWISSGMNKNNATFSWDIFNSMDRDIIDNDTERYSFVPEPVIQHIKNPVELKSHSMLHPQNPERGFREYTLKPDASIYFPAKDMLEIAEGETIRLKDLCVARRENGKIVYSDNKPVGRVKIIQWAPENSSKVSIFHPDGSIDSGMLEPLATRKNMVVQLERYGYVNLQGDKGYFLHK